MNSDILDQAILSREERFSHLFFGEIELKVNEILKVLLELHLMLIDLIITDRNPVITQ